MELPSAQVLPHSPSPKKHRGRKLLIAIGLFKLVHATLMGILVFCILCLTNSSVVDKLHEWASDLNVGPDRRVIGDFVENKLLRISHHTLHGIAAGAAFYAILFATEGVGLLMDKLWAEWLAVIATASLIPLEVMETFKRHGWQRAVGIGTILINIGIVIYLAVQVRKRIREHHAG